MFCVALRQHMVLMVVHSFVWGLVLSVSNRAFAQGPQADADAMFRQLDVNRDGKLTKSEVGPSSKGLIDHVFRMGEKPDNGSMTREEFQKVFEKHRSGNGGGGPARSLESRTREQGGAPSRPNNAGGLPPVLQMLDGNNDQRLTRAELNRVSQLFDRLDTNKDGALDLAEIEAAGRESASAGREESERPAAGTGSATNRDSAGSSSTNSTDSGAKRNSPNVSQLDGVWRGWVVHGRGENPNEGEMEIELTVAGTRMTGRELGTRRGPREGLGSGTFTMTGNGRSGNLDTVGDTGSQDGRNSMGIFELNGDTLKWCVTQRNRQRPTTMATDRGNYLLVLRKQNGDR